MKEFLDQLIQISEFDISISIDSSNDYFFEHILSNIHYNDSYKNEILELLNHTKPSINKSTFIKSVEKYKHEHDIKKPLTSENNINSIYFFAYTKQNINKLICLCSSKKIELDKKDRLLIDNMCENYFLNQIVSSQKNDLKSENKELFEIIFNSVPESISFHELPSHKIIMVNKAFEDYTGYSQENTFNKTIHDLNLWGKDSDRIRYRDELLKKRELNNFTAEIKLKNGEIGTSLISGKIVQFSNRPHLLLIIRDITKIQKIQNKLKSSEKKFRNLFNSLPDPVSINLLDNSMAFTDVNNAFTKITHMKASELIGKSGYKLNLWDDPNQRKEYIQHIKKHGEISNYQARIKYPNGKTEEGLISAKSIEIDNEPHLLVILKSIDSLIKLKHSLEISEKKFRSIFDSSPDAININKLTSGEFVDINDSFVQITGYTREELINQSFDAFDFWHSKEDAQYYLNKLKNNGHINNFETKVKLKDDNIIHILISAIIIEIANEPHIVNLSRNIEDIKTIQRGLNESESRFRTIVEKSHSAVIIIDENQKFIYANPKAQFLFGYDIDELIGMKLERVLHPDSIEIVTERYRKRQSGVNVPEKYEFKILQKNGGIREVEISSSVYVDKNGKIRSIAQFLDITERKKAFTNLKKEQKKAQNYLDIAAFMIISIDKSGLIKLVNQKACDILGYSESELIGNNWFKLCLPKSTRDHTKFKVGELFKSSIKNSQSENIIETKDGKERTINWHSTVIYDEDGEATEILSAGEDITDKVNSLKIINQTKTVAIIWQYLKDSSAYPVKYVSENIENLIGYSNTELISGKIQYIDLIHPNDSKRVLKEIKFHVNNKSKQYTHEYYRLKTKDKNWVWVEDQTEFILNEHREITHLSGILIDVSERKHDLELIKSNEERYKTIFFSNLDGMAIFNDKGKIVEVNDVLIEMYGYSKEELLNRKDHSKINIGSDLDLPYVKMQLQNQDSISSESIDTRKDGSIFHVSSKLRWINYNNKNHILAIFRDITDKKASEMELLNAKEKAEESDRLKSSFLANMSHEIRTPMNAIIGFAGLLEDPDLSEEEKLSFVSRIRNNSQQLLRLINDIIDISKIEANQVNLVYSKIQINLFLQGLFELFELEAKEKNIHMTYECHDLEKMNNFKSDTNRLTQIITNLMSNALKFTPRGGNIVFGSYPSPSTGEVILFVKDSGIGIAKKDQDLIFQRFRQAHTMTHTDYGGTGLGLSIVKGLIDSMKGTICLESEEGLGSQFFIALPHEFDSN